MLMIKNTLLYKRLKQIQKINELKAWRFVFDTATKKALIKIMYEQLDERGTSGNGQVIGYYSFATELITKGRKQQGDHYTLNDTGAFRKSFEIYVGDSFLEINADGRKGQDNLFVKYGENITSFDEISMEKAKEIIRERYRIYLKKLFGID